MTKNAHEYLHNSGYWEGVRVMVSMANEHGRVAGRYRGRAIPASGKLEGQRAQPDGAMAIPQREGAGRIQHREPSQRPAVLLPGTDLCRNPWAIPGTSGSVACKNRFGVRSHVQ